VNAGTSAGNSKQLVVVSDGESSFGAGDSEQAAEDAANDGFVVHSVLLPGGSQSEMEDIADAGGGIFTDASDISTLVDIFTSGALVGLDRVEVTDPDGNTTVVATDGLGNFSASSFALNPGDNTWVAKAFATDGSFAEAELTLTAVPVPAALPLLATALGGLAYWRRRQSNA
jgi:hypothetical protein